MSNGGGGKQWAGRLVAVVQLACWCAVSGLLFNRGLTNLQASQEQVIGRPARGFTAGVIMVSVSCIMLLLSPTFLLMKLLEMRRKKRILIQLTENDLPPSYEEAVERAPRYSTLFLVAESSAGVDPENDSATLLENSCRVPIILPGSSEAAPRYSSIFPDEIHKINEKTEGDDTSKRLTTSVNG